MSVGVATSMRRSLLGSARFRAGWSDRGGKIAWRRPVPSPSTSHPDSTQVAPHTRGAKVAKVAKIAKATGGREGGNRRAGASFGGFGGVELTVQIPAGVAKRQT